MTPDQYVAAWKRFVHVLHGEGEEDKQLERQMKEAWPTFTREQQSYIGRAVCNAEDEK